MTRLLDSLDNALAKKLLGWEPKVLFREGLKRTIDWYYSMRDRDEVKRIFSHLLPSAEARECGLVS